MSPTCHLGHLSLPLSQLLLCVFSCPSVSCFSDSEEPCVSGAGDSLRSLPGSRLHSSPLFLQAPVRLLLFLSVSEICISFPSSALSPLHGCHSLLLSLLSPLQTWQGQRKRTNAGPLLSGQHQKNIGNRCEALTRMGLVWLLRWPLKTSLVAFADSHLCEGFPRTAPGDSQTPAGCPTTQVTSDTVYLGTASDPTNLCPLQTPLTSPGCHLSFSPASYIGRRPPHSVLGFRLLERFREKMLQHHTFLSFFSVVFSLLLVCFMMLFAYRKMMERLEEFPYSESPGEPHLQGEITSQPPESALQAAPLCAPLSWVWTPEGRGSPALALGLCS